VEVSHEKPPSKEEIQSILRENMPDLSRRYHVKSLGIFGSYVRGEQTRDSDVDLLVEFEQTPDLFEFMDLEDELRSILGVEVDLVTRSTVRGDIGQRVLQEVVSL
jgi:uncharacterized protein